MIAKARAKQLVCRMTPGSLVLDTEAVQCSSPEPTRHSNLQHCLIGMKARMFISRS